jgi:hypothetical protein
VCPDHQAGPDEWCKLCRTEYVTETHGIRLRPILILMLGAGIGATVVGACVSMATGRGMGSPAVLVGPLVGTGLAAGLVAIFHRYARRAWFVRTRPDRSAKGPPAHISTPLPPDISKESEGASDTGVRGSSAPATGLAAQIGAAIEADEVVLARVPSVNVGAAREVPVSLRALALSNASVTAADGGAVGARASNGPGRRRTSSGSLRASVAAAPTQLQSAWPRALSRPAQASSEASSVMPPTLGVQEMDAPRRSQKPSALSIAAAPSDASSHEAGSVYPSESSREAEERGRTLKLLSDHAAGAPPSVSGTSRGPSSVPAVSVRPVVDASARRVEFPDYSDPPAAPERTSIAARVEPVAPIPQPAPAEEAGDALAVAAAPSPAHSVPAAPPVRAADASIPVQATWQAVLQATGTADGW